MKKVTLKGKQNSYLYKRGDVYGVRASRIGKPRLDKTLNTTDIVYARELRDKIIAEYFNDEIKKDNVTHLARDKFDEWVNGQRGWRESTKSHIIFIWNKHLKGHFGNLHLDQIDSYSWENYMNKKVAENPNRRFFNEKKYLRMFLKWCVTNGLKDSVPDFQKLDEETEGQVYTDKQIDDLLLHADMDLHLQILMGFKMGMRKGEILSLEWWQIDFDKGTIHLPKEKTKIKKARTFKINSEVFNVLQARKESSKSPWVFPSPKDSSKGVGRDGNKSAWKSCKEKAKVVGKFHWLRHTFLTRAFKTATNPMLVCSYAGLTIEVAQKVYLHLDHNDTESVSDLVR